MECETISDFEKWATDELRVLLTEAGFEHPERYRVVVALPTPGEETPASESWTKREAARFLSEVMQIPMSMFGLVEDDEGPADGA